MIKIDIKKNNLLILSFIILFLNNHNLYSAAKIQTESEESYSSEILPIDASLGLKLFMAVRMDNKPKIEELIAAGAYINTLDKLGNTPLIFAAIQGNYSIALILLNSGANMNIENNKGFTPLIAAVHYAHKDIVDLLLNSGADFDKKNSIGKNAADYAREENITDTEEIKANRSAILKLLEAASSKNKENAISTCQDQNVRRVLGSLLYDQCRYDNKFWAQKFISLGAEINISQLFIACECRNTDIVRMLLRAGVKPDGENVRARPLLLAMDSVHIERHTNYTQETDSNRISQINAKDNKDIIRLLINARTNVNNYRYIDGLYTYTPLSIAIRNNLGKEIINLLLTARADVNYCDSLAFITAVQKGDYDIVELLIKSKANIDAFGSYSWNSSRGPAIMIAICKGNKKIAELLLNAGADLTKTDDTDGDTLLMKAIYQNKETVELLLMTNPNLEATNKGGRKAIDYALKKYEWANEKDKIEIREIIKMLEDGPAKLFAKFKNLLINEILTCLPIEVNNIIIDYVIVYTPTR